LLHPLKCITDSIDGVGANLIIEARKYPRRLAGDVIQAGPWMT
jgi:hypothetical protein